MEFNNLNVACSKNPYPMLDINRAINGSSGYRMLSFMDSYSGYNQIRMDPLHAPKTVFMSNHDNYNYNVMPFDLENVDSTYQRLMEVVFSHHTGRNLKNYVDGMILKTTERCRLTIN